MSQDKKITTLFLSQQLISQLAKKGENRSELANQFFQLYLALPNDEDKEKTVMKATINILKTQIKSLEQQQKEKKEKEELSNLESQKKNPEKKKKYSSSCDFCGKDLRRVEAFFACGRTKKSFCIDCDLKGMNRWSVECLEWMKKDGHHIHEKIEMKAR